MTSDTPPDLLPTRRPPQPAPPDAAEQQEAWHLVEQMWQDSTEGSTAYQFLAGAVAAARWTSRWTAEPPLTQELVVADQRAMREEAMQAMMATDGAGRLAAAGVNRSYARGAEQWLMWILGHRERPRWLRRSVGVRGGN